MRVPVFLTIVLFVASVFISATTVFRSVTPAPYLIILGTAQDGGYPQAGCKKNCCSKAWNDLSVRRYVSCIALVDPSTNGRWIFDCTPDFPAQLRLLDSLAPAAPYSVPGIFLTHAHMGHYAGLMHLGREVMGAKDVNVWAMPRMKNYLETNGPWSQLVKLQNISLKALKADSAITYGNNITVTPLLVPHRDEYSETVGFRIKAGSKTVLFIPDIDKWSKWTTDIRELVKSSDLVLIDGTFFAEGEIGRNMAEVPHPFITESMELLKDLPATDKAKVFFIHLNHTNPALQQGSEAQKKVKAAGFNLAEQGAKLTLQ